MRGAGPTIHLAAPDALEAAMERVREMRRETVRLAYRTQSGTTSERRTRPLALWFWGANGTLVAWCELRDDLRMSGIDRLAYVVGTGERYPIEPGQRFADMENKVEAEEGCRMPPDPFA